MQAALALKEKSSHVGLKRSSAHQLDVAQKSQRPRPAAHGVLSLNLEKRSRSFFDNLQLLEVTDPNLIQAMITSTDTEINHQFNPSKYSQKMAQQLYRNQQEQLRKYGELYDNKIKAYIVTYYKPKWGRAQVKHGLGYYCTTLHYYTTLLHCTVHCTLHYTTLHCTIGLQALLKSPGALCSGGCI